MVLNNQRKTVELLREKLDSISNPNAQYFDRFKGLPFYDWQDNTSNNNTFNHVIGLPKKGGLAYPLFDYEQMLYDTLESNKHVWVKKATGLGITEFILRYMAWLCFKDDSLKGSQMCIITGPREDLAIGLIDRMKKLFLQEKIPSSSAIFDTKETVIELNGCHIESYPSNHLDAARGLKDVAFLFLDECDFFRIGEQQNARDVSERYIAKSNPWIVMVSTPNAPEGLFERIEQEPESTCLYRRLFLDYTYGLDRIYTQEEIQQAKASPSFEREYNLKYLGLIGNVFHTKDIEAAIEKGRNMNISNIQINSYTQKSVGLDPGFGSSNFGVCITELIDGMVNVLHAEEYHRPDFNEMIKITVQLLQKYDIRFDNSCRIFVDGANPSFISTLKQEVNEDSDYTKQITYYKNNYAPIYDLEFLQQNMFVIPVPFSKEHKGMLAHCKELLEYQNGMVAISPTHTKLITALRTAVENGEGSLDKEATSHDDLFDSFRLSLMFWH
jgi:hypothetical protein